MYKNVLKFLTVLPTLLFLGKQVKDEVAILVPDQQQRRTANEEVPPQTNFKK